jgi:phosphoglucosamine mutase
MPQLFGTDGVRGRAGEYPLDPATVARLGAALVRAMRAGDLPLRMIVGRDTRESGEWIERELARGAGSAGATITSAGVIPTPAIAYVTRELGFDAGIVISASHNPFHDNGIKRSRAGARSSRRPSSARSRRLWRPTEGGAVDGRAHVATLDVADAYLAHTRLSPDPSRLGRFTGSMPRRRPASRRRGSSELGRRQVIGAAGCNINLDWRLDPPGAAACGGRIRHDGIAFDGDGDRAIFVDANGAIVDGDAVLLMCSRQMKATGRLEGNAVVATVMSNIGLEIATRQRYRAGANPGRRQSMRWRK